MNPQNSVLKYANPPTASTSLAPHTSVSGELKLLRPLGWLKASAHWLWAVLTTLSAMPLSHTLKNCSFQWKKLSFFLIYTASSFPFLSLALHVAVNKMWWWGLFPCSERPPHLRNPVSPMCQPRKGEKQGTAMKWQALPSWARSKPELHGWARRVLPRSAINLPYNALWSGPPRSFSPWIVWKLT